MAIHTSALQRAASTFNLLLMMMDMVLIQRIIALGIVVYP